MDEVLRSLTRTQERCSSWRAEGRTEEKCNFSKHDLKSFPLIHKKQLLLSPLAKIKCNVQETCETLRKPRVDPRRHLGEQREMGDRHGCPWADPGLAPSQGLVLYQRKMLVFLVMLLALLPHAPSGFQKPSGPKQGSFLQFSNILSERGRPLPLQKTVHKWPAAWRESYRSSRGFHLLSPYLPGCQCARGVVILQDGEGGPP